ncbi:MAG: NGG1p interacting factor NIF3 [archaeon]
MKLKQLHDFLVNEGINADPRGKKEIDSMLEENKKNYKELKEEEKELFDKESLWNPYPDTRVLYGKEDKNIKKIFIGIDMEGEELLLADRLNEKGEKIDLVLAHHPEGKALATLYSVMHMQEEILHQAGVPINVAEGIMRERIGEVERGLSAVNHRRSVDIARLLKIPLMCCHTASDNHVVQFIRELLEKKKPQKVKDLMNILLNIPEYRFAAMNGAGPKIFIGSEENRCGKIYVDMTGGTEPAKEVYEKLVQAGIGTVVGMHLSSEHKKEAEKNKFNYVVAGHISSDSIGLNLLLDKLERKGKFQFIEGSGFKRVRRK